jgi:uncharacterized protein YbaP (TraB family)
MPRLIPLLLILVLVLLPLAGQAADDPLFCWTATRDGATLHLLGSIHAGQADWYPLDDRLEAAFTAADTIACEINVADPQVAMQTSLLVMKEGMYPADESLQDHVSAETWAILQERVAGSPMAGMLPRMRPGLAAVTVMQSVMGELGLDALQGVDMHLLTRAMEADRPVVSLETPEQQVALIFGPDSVIDALLLEEALAESTDEMKAMLERLLKAWREGDPEAMEAVYREDFGDDPRLVDFHEELLVKRNRGMADRLADRQGRWFVVVGAMHLCGDDGVPALLAEAGWTVAQVR